MTGLPLRAVRAVWVPAVLIAALLLAVVLVSANGDLVLERTATLLAINLVIAVAFHVFSGNSGVLSFGHLAFVALGAYVCALLTIPANLKASLFPDMPSFLVWILDVEMGLVPAALLAGACAAVLALVVAPTLMRLSGLPAGISTLALLVIVYTVLLHWEEVTRGSSTMIGVPPDVKLGGATAVACAAVAIAWAFQRSRAGLRLRASREDEVAAAALGVRVAADRTRAWVLSAFLAGVGGAFYSHFITTFTPSEFYLEATFMIIAMIVVGGLGSLTGTVLGVVLITVLDDILGRMQDGGLFGLSLPAGSAALGVAILLLAMLVKRPDGLTGGRELPLPRAWRRGAPAGAG
ncbi:MAG TPA: branched-chain amino acid ABC transporter permease, partial [Thermoleophilaceae bacterium]|nr:branched-chain amino acid ABC transporter permease [Thermoleophilaceae bacterium]